ncbi:MAG: glycogen(starch) synthase [Roseivirga sp.]|jgi:glycogen(starch) synthase
MTSTKNLYKDNLLIECSWEVCNQLGGIYTVIRSKLPATLEKWSNNYCLVGPLVNEAIDVEFEDITEVDSAIGKTVSHMRDMGYEIRYGTWLVSGRPKVVLLNPDNVFNKLDAIKQRYFKNFNVPAGKDDSLYDVSLQWCDTVYSFMKILREKEPKKGIIFHGHEWMTCGTILDLKKNAINVKTVFTTHATRLGRVLATNIDEFYSQMSSIDDEAMAKMFGISGIHKLEKEGAKTTDIFTTVSQITAEECEHLLGTKPHHVTPNGLNLDRYSAQHKVHIRHDKFKEKINDFIMGHFFHSQPFNLNKTLYFFTSGRYEHQNKGFDITIKALAQLNEWLKKEKIDVTVVMFFITKADVYSINPDVLHSRALLEEIRKNCGAIEKEISEKLFINAASSIGDHRLPPLNDFVDDYWRLRYRRAVQSWKTDRWPYIVTHNLVNDIDDPILKDLRASKLFNSPLDKVKIVYHPEFISSTNPLFALEYSQFVRGCHMGIFPSYYEPWGYTPLECIARGVPTITSDLSGFGSYIEELNDNPDETGVFVLKRKGKRRELVVEDLAKLMFQFSKSTQGYRSIQRNKLEGFSQAFDWHHLTEEYDETYRMATA